MMLSKHWQVHLLQQLDLYLLPRHLPPNEVLLCQVSLLLCNLRITFHHRWLFLFGTLLWPRLLPNAVQASLLLSLLLDSVMCRCLLYLQLVYR